MKSVGTSSDNLVRQKISKAKVKTIYLKGNDITELKPQDSFKYSGMYDNVKKSYL
jgi:hypothetical protein